MSNEEYISFREILTMLYQSRINSFYIHVTYIWLCIKFRWKCIFTQRTNHEVSGGTKYPFHPSNPSGVFTELVKLHQKGFCLFPHYIYAVCRQLGVCWFDDKNQKMGSCQLIKLWCHEVRFWSLKSERLLGAVSIRKTVLPGMAIPMLKIRRPNGRLIFNMEIAIRR